VALANKESMVVGGELLTREAALSGARIIPVDSEHSGVFQCLAGEKRGSVRKVILTASGGPFLKTPLKDLGAKTPEEALRHPRWVMGRKVTIDSATLMNKGLELIEARWLFDIDYDRIDVVVHPQSIVHSMVEFVDGSLKAQLGLPDMKLPIQYALNQGERLDTAFTRMDFTQALSLTFEAPDRETFRALPLAYEAGRQGSTFPCVMNASNEVGVQAFIDGKIGFVDMIHVVEEVLMQHTGAVNPLLEDYMAADAWARYAADKFVNKVVK